MDEELDQEEEVGDGVVIEEEIICEEGAPEWVVTFGDMMSLLLTFFILLLSFADMNAQKFKQLSGSIRHALGIERQEPLIEIPKGKDIVAIEFSIDFNAKKVLKRLKRELDPLSLKKEKGSADIEIYESYRGIVVLTPADRVFVEGTAQLRDDARPLLLYIAREAQRSSCELVIETRSPEQASRGPEFNDVWALTAAQAVAVSHFMRGPGELDPVRLRPVGRGSAPSTPKLGRSPQTLEVATVEFLLRSHKLAPGR